MPADSRSPGQDAGAPGASPPPGLSWRRAFPGEERQIGVLRRWLASLLPPCPARDDLTYVASELGTNALLHTASGQGGSFEVEVTWHGPAVRVAVTDEGAPASPRVTDDPLGETGRGLLVVRSLAVRTGQHGDHRGRVVWADIPWQKPATGPVSLDPRETAISDGLARLASRHRGVPAWFGLSTLRWWALAGGKLVTAPSADELSSLLDHLPGAPPATSEDPAVPGPARPAPPRVSPPHSRPSDRRDTTRLSAGTAAVA